MSLCPFPVCHFHCKRVTVSVGQWFVFGCGYLEIVTCGISVFVEGSFVSACGIYLPDPGLNLGSPCIGSMGS